MAEIRYARFHGIRPAIHPGLQLPGGTVGHATVAHNTRLQDGALRAMREDVLIADVGFEPRTLTKLPSFECCAGVHALPYCANVFEMPADTCGGFQHIAIFSNDACHPHERGNPCNGETWPLTVPRPQGTLAVTATGFSADEARACGVTSASTCTPDGPHGGDNGCNVASGRGPEQVSYLYTFVDQFGVESPPSTPTTPVQKWDDQSVTLSFVGFEAPPNAACVRVYRSVMDYGADPLADPSARNPTAGSFQLVTELPLPLTATTFVDDYRLSEIAGDLLTTAEDCPPPACFEQVIMLESGYYVGFNCNDIFVSERHEPWNWPEKHRITLPDRIVGMTAWNNNFFVGTTGHPYYVKVVPKSVGQGLQQQFDTTIDPMQFPHNYPLLQRQTMVATPTGALYVSHVGLIGLKPNGTAAVVTRHRIGSEAWLSYAPNIAAWHDGRYIGVRAPVGKGILIDMREAGEGGAMDFGDVVTFSMPASVLHAGRDGHLYFAQGTTVRRAFGAPSLRTYRWKSRTFRAAAQVQMGAAKLVGEYGPPVKFTLYVGGRVVYTRQVSNSRPFRLPRISRSTEFAIEIEGSTVVTEVHVGPSISSLATDAMSTGSGQGTGVANAGASADADDTTE